MEKDKKAQINGVPVDTPPEKKLTRINGAPVPDNTNSLTAGARGPMVMQDVWHMEKLAHFDREVIPERRMHAKGSGAFGTFRVTADITQYTCMDLFSKVGNECEVFVRFSTVAGERGAADAERDIRGFATRFYTMQGNWDLVGNNTPVFFLRDGLRFPDLNHAVKRDPKTNMRNPQNNWDFWSSLPEALHQVTITMSDRGIPKSYRHMHGFGSHTYAFYNAGNQRYWVKFHWVCQQGIENITDQAAEELVGRDRESHQRDLFEAIERAEYPRWTLNVQIMTEEQANNHRENPFDISKVWFHDEYPLMEVGVMELNRNPENYFADVEQAAFNPAHFVPGIGPSPDKLLQSRLFSYGDAQRYRIGVNKDLIPVNRPKVPVHAFHRDGAMRVDGNYGGATGYEPNSYGQWAEQPAYKEPPLEIDGPMFQYEPKDDQADDCYYQPGKLWRLQSEDAKQRLVENTGRNMAGTTENIRLRHAAHCFMADAEYGERIAKEVGVDVENARQMSKLTHAELMQATMIMKPDVKELADAIPI